MMPDLAYARALAGTVTELLAPSCERIIIAGSVRREKPLCRDLEIIAIPRIEWRVVGSLFGEADSQPFSALDVLLETECNGPLLKWQMNKNGNRAGNGDRYKKLWAPFPYEDGGTKIDIFLCQLNNFGNTLVIRTGSAQFSEGAMWAAKRAGLAHHDGFLWRGDERLVCEDEEAFFDTIGWATLLPRARTLEAAQRLCPGFVPREMRQAK